jgi:mono/diheme cytochrome c family protein
MNFPQKASIALVIGVASLAFAGSAAKPSEPIPLSPTISPIDLNQQWMIEGEKRFRSNCGRCHQPPHRFSPRTMAMAVRQMRVRAMLTEDDMKYILYYVTH